MSAPRLELLHARPATAVPGRLPILFVHGSYCGAWVWAETFLPYFARAGFAAYAVSLRGHGDSEGDLAFASLSDYVEDVRAAIAHLGGHCILVGHSMGGIVAQHCFGDGDTVAALVLMASVPPSGLANSAMTLMMTAPDLMIQFGLLQSLGPSAVTGDAIRRAILSDATPEAEVARLLPQFQTESHTISLDLMTPPPPPRPVTARPVLVLGGSADPMIPTADLREAAAFYKADLEILDGAPHGLMLDSAWWQPTADRILAWLAAKGFGGTEDGIGSAAPLGD
ncbi:alpha/beta hydrolase [Magnetospirillum fulvum]|uniref:Lysophospholipase, alpha-beta hydrolase superfamily n=1 Tax=Magnetospirillum fulvum TaxID=1082 RepID=A0A1H6IBH8_MAGFU|nr:alpha/beta fold hydrolase [Magnetospirillum fulvum]SEH43745.1 Lysophospholipase, alpha-beta hydrolase superfamily [Magnetospirillum fulvum]